MIKKCALPDVEMNYLVFGHGKRPFVVLPGISLKSVLLSADAVETAYAFLTDACTVYLFDRPKNLSPDATVASMAEDTARVMTAIGLRDCYLFGASQGGMMAEVIACRHPDLVGKMVLASTLCHLNPTFVANYENWYRLAFSRDNGGLLDAFLGDVYGSKMLNNYRAVLIDANRDATEDDYARFCTLCRAFDGFDVRGELKNCRVPTLVVGSDGDRTMTGDATREIADVLGCDRYLYGTEYGHAVYDEAPDFKSRLAAFYGV